MVWCCPAVSKIDYEWWNRVHHVSFPNSSSYHGLLLISINRYEKVMDGLDTLDPQKKYI